MRKKVVVSCESLERRAASNNSNSKNTPLCPQFLLHRKKKTHEAATRLIVSPSKKDVGLGGVGTMSIMQES